MATIAIAITVAFAAILASSEAVAAHPLHTSLAEIVHYPATRELRLSVRIFVDDFSRAAEARVRASEASTRATGATARAESPYLGYVRAMLVLTDPRGRLVPLGWCGWRRVGDLVWLCFRANAPAGPSGFQVADRILFDLYADQINIVQATYGGNKANLLFIRGDGFKRLR